MATIKVDVNFDPTQATISIKKTFEAVIKSKALNKEIGADVVKTVKAQARLGKPLNDDGVFPDLAEITIKNRKYLEKYNTTGPNFKPNKANVTLTGQLLESLKSLISRGGFSYIFFEGARSGYKTGPNSVQKNPPDNSELAIFLAEKGFIVFTAKGINTFPPLMKRINAKVKKYLRRALAVRNKLNQ